MILDKINRYLHGYVAIPVILACRENNVFQILQEKKIRSLEEISKLLKINLGYLAAAFRMFESLNWLKKNADGFFELTLESDAWKFIHSLPQALLSMYQIPVLSLLHAKYQQDLTTTFLLLKSDNFPALSSRLVDFLHGVMIVPLLIALKYTFYSTQMIDDLSLILNGLSKELRQLIKNLFIETGCIRFDESLTEEGKTLLNRAFIMGTAASYAPMLANMRELLSGDPSKVFKKDQLGHEQHIDRVLNVLASGFQHERYFKDVKDIIISIFSSEPFESQPKYIIDTGCGDGSLLKTIYEVIVEHSTRGSVLHQYPLHVIGIDFNPQSLEETEKTLVGIPHYLACGDISDPGGMIANLRSLGIEDIENSLHVRSFLDHERSSNLSASKNEANRRSRFSYSGIHIDSHGNRIPPHLSVQNLVEHLARWSSILSKHGLLILEAHSLPSKIVASYLDECESFHFDAYHAFSMQQLVEADTFLFAAAETGLFPVPRYAKLYPKIFPFTRITLNYFQKKPYTLSNADPSDLASLINLEHACLPEQLRVSPEELSARLERYPEGQYVIKMEENVVGAIYTQKISNISQLEQISFDQVGSLHCSEGSIIQFLGFNILPELQDRGLGDQILEFMILLFRMKNGIEKIVGITHCKNLQMDHHLSLERLIARHKTHPEETPNLLFHTSHGANISAILPTYRPEKKSGRGADILIEYPIRESEFNPVDENSNLKKKIMEETLYTSIKKLLSPQDGDLFTSTNTWQQLGFDSLGLLELRALLSKQFGLKIESADFFQYQTPQMLYNSLHRSTIPHLTLESSRDEKKSTNESEAIAVIGMSCRLPGGSNTLADFWQLLKEGKDMVSSIPSERLELKESLPVDSQGGFLNDVDKFDAAFFNISPREAELMDPQQRILLETTWEALEHAGVNPESLQETQTGVFIGIFSHDYENLIRKHYDLKDLDMYYGTGNSASIAAGRLSYFFGLQGTSIAINTACSSSLVALHLACQSLRQGESQLALAGGVNLILSPELTLAFTKAGMLADDGRCKAFDARADGYGRSEACAMVVLKGLSQALAEGDQILAVLKTTAVNQDGASNGLTAPNLASQIKLIQSSLIKAHIDPATVNYIETHGTGTALGDPIEMKALMETYGKNRQIDNPLFLGSAKTNIGHTEAAAGIVGLIKVILSLQHRLIPPHIHFNRLNPHIDLKDSNIQIVKEPLIWTLRQNKSRRAAVCSFGFSGTNAHVIVEEGPEYTLSRISVKPYYLLTLSAKHLASLKQKIIDLTAYLQNDPEVPLEALSYSLNATRQHFEYRYFLVVSSVDELSMVLEKAIQEENILFSSNALPKDPLLQERANHLLEELFNRQKKGDEYFQALQELGKLYIKGYEMNWQMLHHGESKQKVSLPTYPFLKERHWINPLPNLIDDRSEKISLSSLETLQKQISQLICDLLKIKENNIDVYDKMKHYGMDSVNLIELEIKISDLYQIEIDFGSLFEHETIHDISNFLMKKYQNNSGV